MKDLNNLIETLAKKADALAKAHGQSKMKIASLQSESKSLHLKMEQLNSEIDRLKEENKVLKMASALKGDESTVTETKRKISQMVREIDRCIAKLND